MLTAQREVESSPDEPQRFEPTDDEKEKVEYRIVDNYVDSDSGYDSDSGHSGYMSANPNPTHSTLSATFDLLRAICAAGC